MVNYYITNGVVSIEDNMECPKCSGVLRQREGHWVCSSNPYCNYQREIIKPVPSQAELLIKVKELEELVAKLTKELSHNIP